MFKKSSTFFPRTIEDQTSPDVLIKQLDDVRKKINTKIKPRSKTRLSGTSVATVTQISERLVAIVQANPEGPHTRKIIAALRTLFSDCNYLQICILASKNLGILAQSLTNPELKFSIYYRLANYVNANGVDDNLSMPVLKQMTQIMISFMEDELKIELIRQLRGYIKPKLVHWSIRTDIYRCLFALLESLAGAEDKLKYLHKLIKTIANESEYSENARKIIFESILKYSDFFTEAKQFNYLAKIFFNFFRNDKSWVRGKVLENLIALVDRISGNQLASKIMNAMLTAKRLYESHYQCFLELAKRFPELQDKVDTQFEKMNMRDHNLKIVHAEWVIFKFQDQPKSWRTIFNVLLDKGMLRFRESRKFSLDKLIEFFPLIPGDVLKQRLIEVLITFFDKKEFVLRCYACEFFTHCPLAQLTSDQTQLIIAKLQECFYNRCYFITLKKPFSSIRNDLEFNRSKAVIVVDLSAEVARIHLCKDRDNIDTRELSPSIDKAAIRAMAQQYCTCSSYRSYYRVEKFTDIKALEEITATTDLDWRGLLDERSKTREIVFNCLQHFMPAIRLEAQYMIREMIDNYLAALQGEEKIRSLARQILEQRSRLEAEIQEWRPRTHANNSILFRFAMRTLVCLAKAEEPAKNVSPVSLNVQTVTKQI